MAFTVMTVTMFLVMIAMLTAIIAAHFSGRDSNTGITNAIIGSLFVIPFGIIILSFPLYDFVTLYDWPSGNPYVLPPQIAIWAAAALGGLLGFKSGVVWNRDGASCVYFLVTIAIALTLLSLVVVFIP